MVWIAIALVVGLVVGAGAMFLWVVFSLFDAFNH